MAFALLMIGIIMVISAVRNTQDTLVALVQRDFTGPGNFLFWVIALFAVGAIGYIQKLKALSDGLLIVIILGLFLSRGNPKYPGGGFFAQVLATLKGTQAKVAGQTGPTNFDSQGRLIVGGNIPNPFGSPPVSPLPPGPVGVGRGVGIVFGG